MQKILPSFSGTVGFLHAINKDLFAAPPSLMRQSRAMASSRKPIVVRKFSRDWCAGYATASFGQDSDELEILDLSGKLLRIPWEQVKWVCYLRDLPASDSANPERQLHKRFSIRPRTPGLWLRMTLTDGEELEGLAANDVRSLKAWACCSLRPTPAPTRSASTCLVRPFNPWKS